MTNVEVSQRQTFNQQNQLTTSSSNNRPSLNEIQTSNTSPISTVVESQCQTSNQQNQLMTSSSNSRPS